MPWCSAVLTGTNTVLTAFHCISSAHAGDVLKVFFPFEGIREVDPESIKPFCFESERAGEELGPEGCSPWTDDLVVLGLKQPYSLLSPLKIAKPSTAVSGSVAAVSGFGYQDTKLSEYGVAHGGNVAIGDCGPNDQGRALCFRYNTADSGDTEIGPFDSGGPMFTVNPATGERSLIGVALGSEPVGGSDGSMRMARYVNLTDPYYKDWLDEEAFSGDFASGAYSIETLVKDDVRELRPGKSAEFTLNVGESSERLLLTLNHDPGPSLSPNNLDLQLPGSLDASCERLASVEVCAVESPPAGSYSVSVGWAEVCGADGECGDPVYDAAYQVTAIALYNKAGDGE
ncbi:MAG: trypsin-like serine protease [Xanthomonadales bacterium]|nr:trypsin-like serine protease [Xanthomonadales bacterium]